MFEEVVGMWYNVSGRTGIMTYVLILKLKTEIYQKHKINKPFNVAVRIYNSLLTLENKKLEKL